MVPRAPTSLSLGRSHRPSPRSPQLPPCFSQFSPLLNPLSTMIFTLPNGRTVEKDATYCVACKTRGRWHHRFFKSYKGAKNEYRSQRAHLQNPNMVAYYGLEDSKLIKGVSV